MIHFLQASEVPLRSPRCSRDAAALNALPKVLDEVLGSFSQDAERFGFLAPPAAFAYPRNASAPIQSNEKNYTIKVATPGVSKEHLKLELVGVSPSRLEISTLAPNQPQVAGTQPRARLLQSLHLPRDAQLGSITSNYKDGLLTITLPKLDLNEKQVHPDEHDPEVVELAASVTERQQKIQDMFEILQVEKLQLKEVEKQLLQARREAQVKRSKQRQELSIDADTSVASSGSLPQDPATNEAPADWEEVAATEEAGARE